MMKKMLMATLGAVALTAVAVPAHAQSTTPTGLSARVGVFFPTNGDVRDATSDTWLTAGLEYNFHEMPVTTPDYRSHLSLSFDWMGSHDVSMMPLLVNYVGEQREFYYTVGAGVAFLHGGGDDTKFGYRLGLGYNFEQGKSPAFLEANYFGTSESRANGIAVSVGIRF